MELKDSIKTYFIIFITIFSTLSLGYICLGEDNIDELNECLKYNDLDYCNRIVG